MSNSKIFVMEVFNTPFSLVPSFIIQHKRSNNNPKTQWETDLKSEYGDMPALWQLHESCVQSPNGPGQTAWHTATL